MELLGKILLVLGIFGVVIMLHVILITFNFYRYVGEIKSKLHHFFSKRCKVCNAFGQPTLGIDYSFSSNARLGYFCSKCKHFEPL